LARQKKGLNMKALTTQTATELLAAIKAKKVSAVEALQACLEQVSRQNQKVNAVITLDVENAMECAKAADVALAKGENWGALHGLPMTIKDSWETAGLRTTAGAKEYSEHVPAKDAAPVARLKAAGAIIFGKTNLPAYAADIQTDNPLFGKTNNPWDQGRTAGGSSGGAAAALATGMTPLELGSDLAGSIRVPAAMCGVYGHKPSFRAIPMRGHVPGPPGSLSEADLAVAGPLARDAADLKLAMDVLSGPSAREGTAWALNFPKPRHKALKNYRVACWFDDPYCPVQGALRDKLEAMADALEKAGVSVDRKARPPFSMQQNHDIYFNLLAAVAAAGLPEASFSRLVKALPFLKLAARFGMVPEALVDYVKGSTQMARSWIVVNEKRAHLRAGWDQFFGEYDLMLTPVLPTNAFPHTTEGSVVKRSLEIDGVSRNYLELFVWPGLSGASYLPASVAPLGIAADGLPASVQIIGPYLEDYTCLDFAAKLGKVFGGFTPPPQ
jgi:amidase